MSNIFVPIAQRVKLLRSWIAGQPMCSHGSFKCQTKRLPIFLPITRRKHVGRRQILRQTVDADSRIRVALLTLNSLQLLIASGSQLKVMERHAPSNFSFVSVSHPRELKHKDAQNVIRRHVMTRVGDSRRKRPTTWALEVKVPHAEVDKMSNQLRAGQRPREYEQIHRALHSYSFFPVDTNARERQLINFSMPPRVRFRAIAHSF